MVLVADSGSTKADWCLINNGCLKFWESAGYNPNYHQPDNMVSGLRQFIDQNDMLNDIESVHFYGSGCAVTLCSGCKKASFETNSEFGITCESRES